MSVDSALCLACRGTRQLHCNAALYALIGRERKTSGYVVCGADRGREEDKKRESWGRKEGGWRLEKKEKRMGEEGGEGRRCKDAAAAAVTPSDGRADRQAAPREGQTDQQRGCNAERAQTVPDCACVRVYAQKIEAGDKNVRACVRLH